MKRDCIFYNHTLNKLLVSGLKEFLENGSTKKLFFDCREDLNSLYHQFGIDVQGKLLIFHYSVRILEEQKFTLLNKNLILASV